MVPEWFEVAAIVIGGVATIVAPVIWKIAQLQSKLTQVCRTVAKYEAYLAPDKVEARAKERQTVYLKMDRLVKDFDKHTDDFEKSRDKLWSVVDPLKGQVKVIRGQLDTIQSNNNQGGGSD